MEEKHWYVVTTYSGHENKVKENLERQIESMGLQDVLHRIIVPEHVEVEYKDGKRVEKIKNMFPGYILVEMEMTDDAWYVVRNSPGVTGFVGSSGGGVKPIPVSQQEIDPILRKIGIQNVEVDVNYEVGDSVRVLVSPFIDSIGTVDSIDISKNHVKVIIDLFGRETPVELELGQIVKI